MSTSRNGMALLGLGLLVLGGLVFVGFGPFSNLGCNEHGGLYVRETGEPVSHGTYYTRLSPAQQRLFDRARTAEGGYELNATESRIDLPPRVSYNGTLYDVSIAISECGAGITRNLVVGVGLIFLGVGLSVVKAVLDRR